MADSFALTYTGLWRQGNVDRTYLAFHLYSGANHDGCGSTRQVYKGVTKLQFPVEQVTLRVRVVVGSLFGTHFANSGASAHEARQRSTMGR